MTLLYTVMMAAGCTNLRPQYLSLSDGIYTMESDIRKPGVQHNYGGVCECRVTIQDGRIRIDLSDANFPVWYEGEIKGCRVQMHMRNRNPDPMLKVYQFTDSWDGHVTADDTAEGKVTMYARTNLYMSGKWSLKRR
jgi:hypothetical protein